MKKLFGKLGPYSSIIQEKLTRNGISQYNLNHFNENEAGFVGSFVIYHHVWNKNDYSEFKQINRQKR